MKISDAKSDTERWYDGLFYSSTRHKRKTNRHPDSATGNRGPGHRKASDILLLQFFHQVLILSRIDHAEESGALPHVLDLAHAWRPHLEDDVCLAWDSAPQ